MAVTKLQKNNLIIFFPIHRTKFKSAHIKHTFVKIISNIFHHTFFGTNVFFWPVIFQWHICNYAQAHAEPCKSTASKNVADGEREKKTRSHSIRNMEHFSLYIRSHFQLKLDLYKWTLFSYINIAIGSKRVANVHDAVCCSFNG